MIGKILCWLGFHDYRVVNVTFGFGTDGVIVGGSGGAIAGITIYVIQYGHNKILDKLEANRIYCWLQQNAKDKRGERYRSQPT